MGYEIYDTEDAKRFADLTEDGKYFIYDSQDKTKKIEITDVYLLLKDPSGKYLIKKDVFDKCYKIFKERGSTNKK